MSVNLLNYPIYKKQIQDGSIQKELNEKSKNEKNNKIVRLEVEKILSRIIGGTSVHNSICQHKYDFVYEFSSKNYDLDETSKIKLLNSLKEKLPDCEIQIDPLKTYILIDWS
jgi:hypothetical protein